MSQLLQFMLKLDHFASSVYALLRSPSTDFVLTDSRHKKLQKSFGCKDMGRILRDCFSVFFSAVGFVELLTLHSGFAVRKSCLARRSSLLRGFGSDLLLLGCCFSGSLGSTDSLMDCGI